jgi:hypothetical protein
MIRVGNRFNRFGTAGFELRRDGATRLGSKLGFVRARLPAVPPVVCPILRLQPLRLDGDVLCIPIRENNSAEFHNKLVMLRVPL